MIGKTVSHYQIVGQLGSGGMGVVYEATDDRLGRSVALKFVPERLAADDTTLKRLRAEARTASGLSHPNICTVYDIGEIDGRPFIVMELLRGESLRERLANRPMRVSEVVDLSIQTADALDYAHANGVMHRDIKPANLFLIERGQVKIVDFGLAKLVRMQDSSLATLDLTATGVTPGTVSYMSPEQISDHVLDGRSDIFSLGVVLYECVTGQKPFAGQPLMVLSAILNSAPAPPATLNAEIPPQLQDVIHKCLEKDRELRYQSAGDLRADLRRVKRDLESGAANVFTTLDRSALGSLTPPAAVSQAALTQAAAPVIGTTQAPGPPGSAAHPARTLMMAAGGVAALAAVGAGAWYMTRRAEPAPAAVATSVPAPAPPAAPATAPAASTPADARNDDALRRFDAAVARARSALAAGDLATATSAIDVARTINPSSPVLNQLSSRLIADLRTRASASSSSGSVAREPAAVSPPPAVPQIEGGSKHPESPASVPAPVVEPPPPSGPVPAAAVPPAPSRAPEPVPTAAAPAPAAAPPAAPPASAPAAEDDDAAIRRTVATYVRAIESKDVALFRSVKPNMSAAEQRRIEDGFRAVTSQRVVVRVLGVDRRGTEALVRLRRTDTIDAGGRQRTTESEQTMTLTRSGTGWTIREIGR